MLHPQKTMHKELEDKDLAIMIRDGDTAAEYELLRRYMDRITLLAKIYLGKNSEELDDAIQQCCYRLILVFRGGKYNPQEGSVKNFTKSVIRNELKNYRKKANTYTGRRVATDYQDEARLTFVDKKVLAFLSELQQYEFLEKEEHLKHFYALWYLPFVFTATLRSCPIHCQ